MYAGEIHDRLAGPGGALSQRLADFTGTSISNATRWTGRRDWLDYIASRTQI